MSKATVLSTPPSNSISVNGSNIEALNNGRVLLNGQPIQNMKEMELAVNTLIKAVIAVVR